MYIRGKRREERERERGRKRKEEARERSIRIINRPLYRSKMACRRLIQPRTNFILRSTRRLLTSLDVVQRYDASVECRRGTRRRNGLVVKRETIEPRLETTVLQIWSLTIYHCSPKATPSAEFTRTPRRPHQSFAPFARENRNVLNRIARSERSWLK
ncbi:unnamed protein product [Xylocopa violacea]|uniref:Uncharacterized protein n=1 Tax=Xylocopa violacea TaxID=135666 RepID=A0ABP1NEP0_XYLVO